MKSVTKFALGVFAASCALVPSITKAEIVNYVINQQLSSIKLDVLVDPRPSLPNLIDATSPQFAGSDIAIPTGYISAYRDGSIQDGLFELLGSSFSYKNNSTPMGPATTNGSTEPAPQPAGTDPAQWGFITNLFNGIIGPTAIRGAKTSVTADLQGLWEGGFDASVVKFNLLQAHNDQSYVGPGIPLFDIDPIDEWSGGDLDPSFAMNTLFNGQLTEVNGVETMYLPISVQVPAFAGSVPIILLFSGEIVATVPEPGTIAMAAFGIVGLVAAGYRARKRNA